MSLRWGDRIDAVLAPRRVTCASAARLPWRRPAPATVLQVDPDPAAPAWSGAVAALAGWIDARVWRRGTTVHVALSNHFVRLLVVPWSDALTSASERQALAVRAFEARYGDDADAWSVRLGACRYGEPALACAVDESLRAALQATCADRGMRLATLQPLLGVACEAHSARLPSDGGLFVVEPGRITGVALEGGACRTVRTLRLDGADWSDAWVERQAGLMGLAPDRPRCVVVAAQAALAGGGSTPAHGAARAQPASPPVSGRGDAARLWTLAAEAAA